MQNVATSAFHSIKQMLYYQPLSLLVSTAKFIRQMLHYQPFSLVVSTGKFLNQTFIFTCPECNYTCATCNTCLKLLLVVSDVMTVYPHPLNEALWC